MLSDSQIKSLKIEDETQYPVQEDEQLEISRGHSGMRFGGKSTGDN